MEQRKTPLLDAIVDYTTNRPVYFKIPGHRYEKGISPRWRQWTGDGIFRFDLTEAEGLDDLHEPEGVIREAQELAAEVFQAKKTYFLVNGTTCGNEAMVLASVKEGEKIMVARNAHKSVLMGLTLGGAVPVYLMPKQDPVTGLWGSLDPETVEEGFRQYPDCKAVFLASPTYYGVCSNIRAIADICHRHGALLLVDEAHGGHLYFQKEGTATETLPRGAILQDADMCAQSMHKVTGSLTQSSLLHVGSDRVDLGRLEACLHMVQSTSPSYLLMTSLDAARYELALHGEEMLQRGLTLAQMAREAMKKIPGITCVGEASRGKAIYDLDLVRLVISASDLGLSGYQLADRLYEKYRIGMELADDRYVVAVVTYANEESDMRQLVEALKAHDKNISKEEAQKRAMEMLEEVGINNVEKRMKQYPHELSGGMRQRVMIAMALACRPKLLIADEPTTALDVTIQAQILKLMNDLKKEKGTSILFITHDLGVINEMADDVAVMYCGQVVEKAPVRSIFGDNSYLHPYTEGLLYSIPRLDTPTGIRLEAIPGAVPHPLDLPKGCKFAPRCKYATDKCREMEPELNEVEPGHMVRCFYPKKGERN